MSSEAHVVQLLVVSGLSYSFVEGHKTQHEQVRSLGGIARQWSKCGNALLLAPLSHLPVLGRSFVRSSRVCPFSLASMPHYPARMRQELYCLPFMRCFARGSGSLAGRQMWTFPGIAPDMTILSKHLRTIISVRPLLDTISKLHRNSRITIPII